LNLLREYLDEEQQEQAERHGGFAIASGGHVFWIPLEGTPWCAHAEDGRVEHLCIAPDKRAGMPDGDVSLTYLLWIKLDPTGFLREANVLSSKRIDWPDSDSQLATLLAELSGPPPSRPPRRAPKKVRVRRVPVLCQNAHEIEAIFRKHGKKLAPELLRKLTSD